jgi:Zn-dependent protease with chaperone function
MLILAPFAALLLQMAISQQREYQADASGARMVGHPYGLIRALEKLGAYNKQIPMDAPPTTSALMIVQPGGVRTALFQLAVRPQRWRGLAVGRRGNVQRLGRVLGGAGT